MAGPIDRLGIHSGTGETRWGTVVDWRRRRRARTAIVAVVLALAVGAGTLWGVFEGAELRALDTLFLVRGVRVPHSPITVVSIDEATLKAHGGWPLPRRVHGDVIERLSRAGAAAIGVDLPGTFKRLTYERVLGQDLPAAAVRGRIVLLGATAKAMHDVFVTPFAAGGDMPGVEILANQLDTLLSGREVRGVDRKLQGLIAGVCAALAVALVARGLRGLMIVVLLVAVVPVGAVALFALGDVWMPVVGPVVAAIVGTGAGIAVRT